MTWDWLRGHHRQVEMFRSAIAQQRLASTFLFVGPAGIGKRRFAFELAKCLFCDNHAEAEFMACGYCPKCAQVDAQTHPDLLLVQKPEDKAVLPIELFIGDREHRMREGLCHDISLKPYFGSRKVAIIDDADFFNLESANCLLKTLEEPPMGSILILLGTSEQKQLPTIRSRTQIIRFQPLPIADVRELLQTEFPDEDPSVLDEAAEQSDGSLQTAAWHCNEAIRLFQSEFTSMLADQDVDSITLARFVGDFVEDAKDSSAKRARMRLIARTAAKFYRDVLMAIAGAATVARPSTEVEQALTWFAGEGPAVDCLQRCVTTEIQIDANVNAKIWADAFINGLVRASVLPSF